MPVFNSGRHSINGMLSKILQNTERIMADVTSLQAADTALKSEVATVIADWQASLAAANGDQAAVDAVAADMQATITQLQASDPAVTVTPPAPPTA